jgi:hypothetical protein
VSSEAMKPDGELLEERLLEAASVANTQMRRRESSPPASATTRTPLRRKRLMEVESEQKLEAELQEFIDQLIVPLLVNELLTQTGHLYSAGGSYYDGDEPLADAAKEAA